MKKIFNGLLCIIVLACFVIGGLWITGIFDPRSPFVPLINGYDTFMGQEVEAKEDRKTIYYNLTEDLGDDFIFTAHKSYEFANNLYNIDYIFKKDGNKYYIEEEKMGEGVDESKSLYYEQSSDNTFTKYERVSNGGYMKTENATDFINNQDILLDIVLRTITIDPVSAGGFTNEYTFTDGDFQTNFKIKDNKVILVKQTENSATTVSLFEYGDVIISIPYIK